MVSQRLANDQPFFESTEQVRLRDTPFKDALSVTDKE